jgi:hypothetical protein
MKKKVLTFVFAVGTLIFSSPLSAQDNPVSVGFKAGTSLSNYRLNGNMKGCKSVQKQQRSRQTGHEPF